MYLIDDSFIRQQARFGSIPLPGGSIMLLERMLLARVPEACVLERVLLVRGCEKSPSTRDFILLATDLNPPGLPTGSRLTIFAYHRPKIRVRTQGVTEKFWPKSFGRNGHKYPPLEMGVPAGQGPESGLLARSSMRDTPFSHLRRIPKFDVQIENTDFPFVPTFGRLRQPTTALVTPQQILILQRLSRQHKLRPIVRFIRSLDTVCSK